MESATQHADRIWTRPTVRERLRSLPLPRPELAALLVLAAVLDLWALGQNGWANEYYSAAVRSMAGSWHNFLYGSFDAGGLMTVDKPPLALWAQALSVKAFGYHPLSILVPQALMGVASVGLLYDLVRRRWGRQAGFVAGLVLALTPIAVAVSRHNNPDALLVLCCVGALWAFVRALEDGATKWLVAAGVCVGLGFETKMGAALMVVPGMALAWLWVAPRGRAAAVPQLLAAGAALVAVALAWPLLVELTPAPGRPWVAGTTDNSVFSLILEYNGFGRLDGQAGGPGGIGGGMFGGATGPLRLLNESLGGQAGWLLGLALVGGLGIAVLSRLRREDPRTGWIVAVGGALAVTAVAFSFAGGIFHPYYVSLLAPFAAALAGATFAQARSAGRPGRLLGVAALAAGAVTELIVIGNSAGELSWLAPAIVILVAAAALALLGDYPERWRTAALACGLGVLLLAPAIWSVQTLGHPTSGTFPAGGPESAAMGGFGGPGGPGGAPGIGGSGSAPGGGEMPSPPQIGMGGMEGVPPIFGSGSEAVTPSLGAEAGTEAPAAGMPGGAGGMFGGQSLNAVLGYTESHGGGTLAVSSQSEAASSIIESGAEVAGIGGFSGKETSVSAAWLREAIASGRIRWILAEGSGSSLRGQAGALAGGGPGGLPGDNRQGSQAAIEAVTVSCREVTVSGQTLYDCGPID
jgi:4-amino-4-deoxy-L-arabinose transferase-like glycosyltransferase